MNLEPEFYKSTRSGRVWQIVVSPHLVDIAWPESGQKKQPAAFIWTCTAEGQPTLPYSDYGGPQGSPEAARNEAVEAIEELERANGQP